MPSDEVTSSDGAIRSIFGTGLLALDVVRTSLCHAARASAGGTCGNVLIALSHLGWTARSIGRLGSGVASQLILRELKAWGVDTEWASLQPIESAPVYIHDVGDRNSEHHPHRFSRQCPACQAWFPAYHPVPAAAVVPFLLMSRPPSVFFVDRASAASVLLAKEWYEQGTLVFFEPSTVGGDARLFQRMLAHTHVLKYSAERARKFRSLLSTSSGPLLEIETLGAEGLRYRSRFAHQGALTWVFRPAVPAPAVRDAAGAGDWCSVGIIDRLARRGLAGLRNASSVEIAGALDYGQALASWNCQFIGARGGMLLTGPNLDRGPWTSPTLDQVVGRAVRDNEDSNMLETLRKPLRDSLCSVCGFPVDNFARDTSKANEYIEVGLPEYSKKCRNIDDN